MAGEVTRFSEKKGLPSKGSRLGLPHLRKTERRGALIENRRQVRDGGLEVGAPQPDPAEDSRRAGASARYSRRSSSKN